ncbi:competence protein CoiA [Priestia filamentosa]|uniref:competence protein CoiA n=1 Tax=Priestia filamentosa TaxID=1402861 RepID=UPI001600C05D|nr:competence protein CoiA family protein [Priestia filamentosa]
MLVAQTETGQKITLLERYSYDYYQALKETKFYCPICKGKLILKVGVKNIAHFAHEPQSSCACEYERETPYHLEGKKGLYRWLEKQTKVKMEEYLPSISQRPDLFLPASHIAIEFQCSALSLEALRKRNKGYYRLNITPLWILSAKRFRRNTKGSLKVSYNEWKFLQPPVSHSSPYLLYYCPNFSRFTIVSDIIAFSPTSVFATVSYYSTASLSLHSLFHPRYSKASFFVPWVIKKGEWRMKYALYPKNPYAPLLKLLYTNHIPPSHFPSEAGLPVKSGYFIESHSCVWQLYILLDHFLPQKRNCIIHYETILKQFKRRIQSRHVKLRELPMITKGSFEDALKEYLRLLSTVGFITEIETNCFLINRMWTTMPIHKHPIDGDYQIMNKLQLKQQKG